MKGAMDSPAITPHEEPGPVPVRARIGVLLPSTDTTLEKEMPRLLAPGMSVHVTRIRLREITVSALCEMEEDALSQVSLLMDAEPDLIVYGCTSGSFCQGPEHEDQLSRRLQELSGVPVIMTARALANAALRRGRRIRLCTPYNEELTGLESRYLEDSGLIVAEERCLGIERDNDVGRLGADTVRQLALSGIQQADAIVLSCTNLPTLDILSEITQSAGVPVVTSNVAIAEEVQQQLYGPAAVSGAAHPSKAPWQGAAGGKFTT